MVYLVPWAIVPLEYFIMSNLDLINVRETLEQQVEPFKAALVEQYLSQVEDQQQQIERQADETEGSSRWFDGRLVRCNDSRTFEKFGHGLSIVWEGFEHGELDEIHRADSNETIGMMSNFNPFSPYYNHADIDRRLVARKKFHEWDGLVRDLFNVEEIIVEECYRLGVFVYSPKTRDEMLDEAKRYADGVWLVWLDKMVEKLENMFVTSIEVSGENPLDNTLVVGSVHGVTFDLKNSIVIKWSERCGYFNQFPARFTNVRNYGDKVKAPPRRQPLRTTSRAKSTLWSREPCPRSGALFGGRPSGNNAEWSTKHEHRNEPPSPKPQRDARVERRTPSQRRPLRKVLRHGSRSHVDRRVGRRH